MSYFNIDDVTVGEGDGQATFRITLSEPLSQTASVAYGYDAGQANRFSDFETFSRQTLTFAPGEVEKQVSVLVNQDDDVETDENFFLTLSEPTNASISDGIGRATIVDDDGPPSAQPRILVDPVTVAETADVVEVVLRLNGPSDEAVEFDYTTIPGRAEAGSDFTSREGDLTFIPGELVKTIRVPITDDDRREGFEGFSIALSNVVGAQAARTDVPVVIADNDGQREATPSVRIEDVVVGENAGVATPAITLSAPSSEATTVTYGYDSGTTNRFSDFETFSRETLTFRPGETRKEIPVLINQDTTEENQNESLFITLSNPSGLSLADNERGQITIIDDDTPDTGARFARIVGSDDVSLVEGVQSFEIPVELTRPAPESIVGEVSVSATSTLSPDEYILGSEELVFETGDVVRSLTVFIDDDEAFEKIETLEVTVDFSDEIENVDTDELSFELTLVDGEISITRSGTSGDDVLRPDQDAAYTIYGGGGADRLTGGEYADVLYGGAGRDFIVGADGADAIYGGGEADRVFAGGSDTGDDTIRGGSGDDILGAGAGEDEVYGQSGEDTLFGGLGDDLLDGGTDNDVAWAGAGEDLVRGRQGADTLGGGTDNDELAGGGNNDVLYGGADDGRDILRGQRGNDTIFAGSGNDTIDGGEGSDVIFNGGGSDAVRGGAGNDQLWGGGGNDRLTGGDGSDTFAFVRGNGEETITDFELDTDRILIEDGAEQFGDLDIGSTGGDAVVSFANVTLTLIGIDQGNLQAEQFDFA